MVHVLDYMWALEILPFVFKSTYMNHDINFNLTSLNFSPCIRLHVSIRDSVSSVLEGYITVLEKYC